MEKILVLDKSRRRFYVRFELEFLNIGCFVFGNLFEMRKGVAGYTQERESIL